MYVREAKNRLRCFRLVLTYDYTKLTVGSARTHGNFDPAVFLAPFRVVAPVRLGI